MLKHLVIAGGGPRCVTFMGAIDVLHKNPQFNGISNFWGNSAGAIVATLLSLKVPHTKLTSIFNTVDFTKFRDVDLTNIMSFGTHWGLDSGDAFISSMRTLLEDAKPGSSEYTMQELPGLHITCSDMSETKPLVLDSSSYPTMKLVDALRASTSIPFFYRPFRNPVDGHLLVDGAIASNFPWIFLPSDEERARAIGLDFTITDYSKEPTTLGEYIPKILNFREHYWGSTRLKPEGHNIIRFNVRGFPAWHLGLKQEDRDELFSIGKRTTEAWLRDGGESWLSTLHAQRGIARNPPPCGPRYTPPGGHPSGRRGGLSGNPLSPFLRPARDSFLGSPSQCQRSSRRWSF